MVAVAGILAAALIALAPDAGAPDARRGPTPARRRGAPDAGVSASGASGDTGGRVEPLGANGPIRLRRARPASQPELRREPRRPRSAGDLAQPARGAGRPGPAPGRGAPGVHPGRRGDRGGGATQCHAVDDRAHHQRRRQGRRAARHPVRDELHPVDRARDVLSAIARSRQRGDAPVSGRAAPTSGTPRPACVDPHWLGLSVGGMWDRRDDRIFAGIGVQPARRSQRQGALPAATSTRSRRCGSRRAAGPIAVLCAPAPRGAATTRTPCAAARRWRTRTARRPRRAPPSACPARAPIPRRCPGSTADAACSTSARASRSTCARAGATAAASRSAWTGPYMQGIINDRSRHVRTAVRRGRRRSAASIACCCSGSWPRWSSRSGMRPFRSTR